MAIRRTYTCSITGSFCDVALTYLDWAPPASACVVAAHAFISLSPAAIIPHAEQSVVCVQPTLGYNGITPPCRLHTVRQFSIAETLYGLGHWGTHVQHQTSVWQRRNLYTALDGKQFGRDLVAHPVPGDKEKEK